MIAFAKPYSSGFREVSTAIPYLNGKSFPIKLLTPLQFAQFKLANPDSEVETKFCMGDKLMVKYKGIDIFFALFNWEIEDV